MCAIVPKTGIVVEREADSPIDDDKSPPRQRISTLCAAGSLPDDAAAALAKHTLPSESDRSSAESTRQSGRGSRKRGTTPTLRIVVTSRNGACAVARREKRP
jgi:hypothetical protein